MIELIEENKASVKVPKSSKVKHLTTPTQIDMSSISQARDKRVIKLKNTVSGTIFHVALCVVFFANILWVFAILIKSGKISGK